MRPFAVSMNGVNMRATTPQPGDLCLSTEAPRRRIRGRFVAVSAVVVLFGLAHEFILFINSESTSTAITGSVALVAGIALMLLLVRWLYKDAAQELDSSSSKLAESNEQASEAVRDSDRYIESLSHEIRTPLASIIVCSDMLAESTTNSLDRKHINTIKQNCRHLLGLIDNLLDVTSATAGVSAPTLSCASVADVINEAIDISRPQADAKGIELGCEYLCEPGGHVVTDPHRLRQILVNLLGNAVRHTDSGSVRVVLAEETQHPIDTIAISVTDTGTGIAECDIGRIFEPHFQGTSSKRVGSAGLGLSISTELAMLLGGSIDVESKVGVGSTFTLRIPNHRSLVFVQDNAPATNTAPLTGRNILIAEDDPDTRALMEHTLRRAGASVVCVSTGQRLVEAVASTEFIPDIALVDLNLDANSVDGIAATRTIRARGNTTPVLALTASTAPADKAACQAAGFDGYLTKPIQPADLIRACSGAFTRTNAA